MRITKSDGTLDVQATQRIIDELEKKIKELNSKLISNGQGQLVSFLFESGKSTHRVSHSLNRKFRAAALLVDGSDSWTINNFNGDLSESEVQISFTGDGKIHQVLIF